MEATSDCLVTGGPELKLSWGTQTLSQLIKKDDSMRDYQ